MKIFVRSALAMLVVGIGIVACSKSKLENPSTDGIESDRKEMLSSLVDHIVIPSYDKFNTKLELFSQKTDAFIAQPDLNSLQTLRLAWQEAYIEWQKVELFDFGPAEKYATRFYFNIYPADPQLIITNCSLASPNLELPSSYTVQGFPALDFLINGVGVSDNDILAFYTTGADAAAHKAYLRLLVTRMQTFIGKVITDWNGEPRNAFLSKPGIDINSSTGLLVNGFVLNYERYIRSGKIGIPSGAMMNGVVAAEKVEAFYKKDISKVLAQTAHQASVDFFNGKDVNTGIDGISLKTYLDAIGAKDATSGKKLSEIINMQFAVCKTKLDGLKPSFYEEINTNNQAMKDAYNELQYTVRLLKVDMTSAMSVTITYSDNDGD